MARVDSFTYTHHELAALMLKERGIHEGYWQLLINFGFGAANMGPDEQNIHPSGIMQVTSIGLSRASGPGPLVVDASIANPG